MRLFVLGAMLVHVAMAAWSQAVDSRGLSTLTASIMVYVPPPSPWLIWALVAALPVAVVYVMAEAVHLVTPRRMLERRVKGVAWRVAAGVTAGLLGAALEIIGVTLLSDRMSDWSLIAAGSGLGALCVLAVLPRIRPGRCIHCGYDQSGATVRGGGRCVECGELVAG